MIRQSLRTENAKVLNSSVQSLESVCIFIVIEYSPRDGHSLVCDRVLEMLYLCLLLEIVPLHLGIFCSQCPSISFHICIRSPTYVVHHVSESMPEHQGSPTLRVRGPVGVFRVCSVGIFWAVLPLGALLPRSISGLGLWCRL